MISCNTSPSEASFYSAMKLPVFYGTQLFITAFKRAHDCSCAIFHNITNSRTPPPCRLLIPYMTTTLIILKLLPYTTCSFLLHPQPEDAACRGKKKDVDRRESNSRPDLFICDIIKAGIHCIKGWVGLRSDRVR